ncbi:MAG: hypothetical protein EBR82_09795 [Caulobacteraceae bacterium]|nr:hypothetical protein [Caulobacteraceae bacterium]
MKHVARPGLKQFGNTASILKFFEDNPGEMLTLDDIQVKFDLTRAQATAAANYLRRNGRVMQLRVYAICVADSKFPGVDIDAAHRKAGKPEQVAA